MFVARAALAAIQCAGSTEEVSPSSTCATANNRRGPCRRQSGKARFSPNGPTPEAPRGVQSSAALPEFAPVQVRRRSSMWAGRSNTLLRVAVISFLFAASAGAAHAQPAQEQKKSEQQKTEQQKPSATPQPTDAQQQPATDGKAATPTPQKGAVPATNGRASSLDIQMDGPRVQPADDTKPVIVHTDLVTLTVTVTDTYGRFVTGLNQNAFQILDDKTPQQI